MDSVTEGSDKAEIVEIESLSRKSSESSSYEYLVPPSEQSTKESNTVTSPVLEYIVAENELQDAISNINMTSSASTANVVGRSIFYSEKATEPSSPDTGE